MTKAKDPAMLFYTQDWYMGTAEMTEEERGIYIDLLAYQHQKGSIPNNQTKLIKIGRTSQEVFDRCWPEIQTKFEEENGRLVNRKLQAVMDDRSIKGRKNKLIGTFGNIKKKMLASKELDATGAKILSTRFQNSLSELLNRSSEWDTDRLSEWCKNGQPFIENEDENEDENKNRVDKGESFSDFITMFNEITGRDFRGDKPSREKFMARIGEGYTIQDIKKALINAKNDRYLKDHPEYITPEYITRPNKLQQWMNAKPKMDGSHETWNFNS